MKYLYAFTLVVNLVLISATTVLMLSLWDVRDASIEQLQAMDEATAAFNNMTKSYGYFSDEMAGIVFELSDYRETLKRDYNLYFKIMDE